MAERGKRRTVFRTVVSGGARASAWDASARREKMSIRFTKEDWARIREDYGDMNARIWNFSGSAALDAAENWQERTE